MMDVTSIVVSADDDKGNVVFFKDGSSNVPIMVLGHETRTFPAVHSMSLPQPLRTSRLWVFCGNSSVYDCEFDITLIGTTVDG